MLINFGQNLQRLCSAGQKDFSRIPPLFTSSGLTIDNELSIIERPPQSSVPVDPVCHAGIDPYLSHYRWTKRTINSVKLNFAASVAEMRFDIFLVW